MTAAGPETLRLSRFAAASIHLATSLTVAAVGALLIFRLWYPTPYDTIAGGKSLFILMISVDVVLGPALTFVIASPGKRLSEFRRDLFVIVALQLAALGFGVHSIALARPVFLSYEIDRFRVVAAADVDLAQLKEAPPELQALPWLGPRQIAAVRPADPAEQLRSIDLGLAGFDLSMFPRNWRTYPSQSEAAWRRARPCAVLLARYPSQKQEAERIVSATGRPLADIRFLPVLSRQASWVALMASPDARIVGYLPVDGFF